jgi:type VI secretion system protein ImpA
MNPLKHLLAALLGTPAQAQDGMPGAAQELLSPVSASAPCGESLEYDAEYAVLQARLAPQGDVQYGDFSSRPPAPDWAEVERDARRLLLRSKDIAVLVWFARARCRLAGAAGLLEGLRTLQAVLQAFPEHVHPQMVIDGAPDPAVRANALAALCDPEGLLADVREVVVCGSTASRLCVRDVERSLAVPRPAYAPEPEAVRRQLAELHHQGDVNLRALLAGGEAVLGIEQWSQSALGDDAPRLVPLLQLLGCLASFGAAAVRGEKVPAEAVAGPADAPAPRVPAAPKGLPQEADGGHGRAQTALAPALLAGDAVRAPVLQEREQIRALLRHIREWVEHHEPSSPVTILLKQADRMWGRRFAEVAHMIPPDLMQAWDRDD